MTLAKLQELAEHEGWDGADKTPVLTETNRAGQAFVYRRDLGGSYAEQRAAWRDR